MEAELKTRWPDVEVELIKGGRGVFDVTVDGKLVFSKHDVGRHVEPGEVTQLLEAQGR